MEKKIKLLNSNYEKYEANLQLLTGKRNVYHLFVSALLVDMECLLDELQYLNYQFVQRGEKIKHEKSVSINLEKATEQEYLEAIERIKKSEIKELVMTNTVPLPKEKQIDKISVVSISELFGEAIKRIHEETSIGELFDTN